jgi:hypothetical protein
MRMRWVQEKHVADAGSAAIGISHCYSGQELIPVWFCVYRCMMS